MCGQHPTAGLTGVGDDADARVADCGGSHLRCRVPLGGEPKLMRYFKILLQPFEEVRRIGQETLHSWAQARITRGEEAQAQAEGLRRAGKKNSAGTPRSAPSR
jgi:hypothetical protein